MNNTFAKSKNTSIRRLGFVPQPNLQKNGEGINEWDLMLTVKVNSQQLTVFIVSYHS
ncbi:MAG: hypothetical protein RMY29_012150 [Nostoc sp. CreGUA01]